MKWNRNSTVKEDKQKFDRIMERYIRKTEKKKIKLAKRIVKADAGRQMRLYKWKVVWPKRAEFLTKLLFAAVCFAIFYMETKDYSNKQNTKEDNRTENE